MVNSDNSNIVRYLSQMSASQKSRDALIVVNGRKKGKYLPCSRFSFREMDELSSEIAAGLEQSGITKGMRTVLLVNPSKAFFLLIFALFKMGAIPVLIDPGMGAKNLAKCLEESQAEAFIGIPKAHMARIVFGWAKKTLKVHITVGMKWLWSGVTLKKICRLGKSQNYEVVHMKAQDPAAILFTSGSTGVAKGVVYNHANFYAQIGILKQMYGIKPGEMDIATFPLFALFGPALEMTVVIPHMNVSRPAHVRPQNIIDCIEEFQGTNMFGSPALLDRVSRYGICHNIKLPSLKRVISGGAPVSGKVLQNFSQMLSPSTPIYTTYGATECLPVCSIDSMEIFRDTQQKTNQGKGVCAGFPVHGTTAHIIKISDAPIATWSDALKVSEGEIGEIVVSGAQVSREYYNNQQGNALAKMITDSDNFYHRMGDLGYFDKEGRIWFCGRKAHRVQIENAILFTVCCEAIFNTHEKVYRSALVGVCKNNTTIPVLCVELEKGYIDRNKIKRELLELAQVYEHTRSIQQIFFHPSFPVDTRHNSKIFREKLSIWAYSKLKNK